jgi:hypothetical protein
MKGAFMRIVVSRYADDEKFAVETSVDGSEEVQILDGQRRRGARISSYSEVVCDDNEKGLARLEESLEFLLKEIRKRRKHPSRGRNNQL